MAAAPQPHFHVAPLAEHHDCVSFTCGNAADVRYLRRWARRDIARNRARIFVATGERPEHVAGYYALSAVAIDPSGTLDQGTTRVPAALLSHLCVASGYHGRGLGPFLLIDALHRVVVHAESAGVEAIVAVAGDDDAVASYQAYGFVKFPTQPDRLFLAAATARQLFA